MIHATTLTSKGQITIPVAIRRKLGLRTGETVRFALTKNNQVIIEKDDWKHGLSQLHKEVAAHLKKRNIKPLTDEELDNAIAEAAQQAAAVRHQQSLE